MKTRLLLAVAFACCTGTHAAAQSMTARDCPPSSRLARVEESLSVKELKTIVPGYPMGHVLIDDPHIAGFRPLPADRKTLTIVGISVGTTLLSICDQQNQRRHEVTITVTSREALQLEQELRRLLKEFPSVEVAMLAGSPVVTGAVSSRDDLAAVERIAAAAKVKCVVRYVPPAVPPPAGEAAPSTPQTPPTPAGAGPPTQGSAGAPAQPAFRIRYEVELMEASITFRTGSYAHGVEPSGRRLYLGQIEVNVGSETEIFIGGAAVAPKEAKRPANTPAQSPMGLRLKFAPRVGDSRARVITAVLVETNLPLNTGTYDPEVWRRSRWEFATVSNEPFGIVGGDLLASRDVVSQGPGALQTTASTASKVRMIPGVGGLPGVEYVPVFGSLFGSRSFKQKTTQLLVVLRPQVIPLEAR